MKKALLVFLMVCLAVLTYTAAAYATPSKLQSGDPIPDTCIGCHDGGNKNDNAEVSNSYHAMMGGLTGGVGMYSGWCAMPNFQVDEQGHTAWVTGCTSCHVGGGVDPTKLVQCQYCHDVNDPNGVVTVSSCTTQCHQAKDKQKRGDDFTKTGVTDDWHLYKGMKCQSCHLTNNHAIAKGNAIDTEESSNETLAGCTNTGCHTLTPHTSYPKLNEHTDKVYCTVCHTGTRAAGAMASRNWTSFTTSGTPVDTSRSDGWLPVKKWWDGSTTDANGLPVLDYTSHKNKAGAKLYPMNEAPITYLIKSSADAYEAIIVPHVKAADANGDRTTTVSEMQAWVNPATGLKPYSSAASNTAKFNWQITHATKADSAAFHCTDCHGSTGWVINWTQIGYASDPNPNVGETIIIRVASITMGKGLSKTKTYATATVNITDTSNNAISGATVDGSWSDLVSGTSTGVTDASGNVTLTSPTSSKSGTITFTVTNAQKDGCTYDATKNIVTSASITVP